MIKLSEAKLAKIIENTSDKVALLVIERALEDECRSRHRELIKATELRDKAKKRFNQYYRGELGNNGN